MRPIRGSPRGPIRLFSAVLSIFKRLHLHYFWPFLATFRSLYVLLFSSVLPIFRLLNLYHFLPFWPLLDFCIFIIPCGPFSAGCILFTFGRSGHFQERAFLLFSAVPASFRSLNFCHFPPFWPLSKSCSFLIFLATLRKVAFFFPLLSPFSRACIFIHFGRFGHFQDPAFCVFRLFCALSHAGLLVVSGRFGHSQVSAVILFSAVCATFRSMHFCFVRPLSSFSRCCILIIFGIFGHFQEATFLLFLAVVGTSRRIHFYYFRAFWLPWAAAVPPLEDGALDGSRCPPAHIGHSCRPCRERPNLSSPFTGPSVSTNHATLTIY